jgi:hypothetical protein
VLDPNQIPPVGGNELLACYVLFSRHFRTSDNTIKPEAFMLHPQIELSMTRHIQATIEELWKEGMRVATMRSATLYGRGDVQATAFSEQGLNVVSAPILENPNHVNATGWPSEKSEQKIKAIEIAIRSLFVLRPD